MTKYTLGGTFECSGIGLHSGLQTTVRVQPTNSGKGRYFVRVDLPGEPVIPARVDAVCGTTLSTELQSATDKNARLRTVEHLLAALSASGVDDAQIEIDGPEVPLLDGSALPWVEAIAQVGVVCHEDGEQGSRGAGEQGERSLTNLTASPCHRVTASIETPSPFVLQEPVWVYQGDAFVVAMPAPTTKFTYGIEFEISAIGKQWHSWSPGEESFAQEIAPARTFGLAQQVEQLRNHGLIKGGSLENALVCNDQGWLNPPLRFANEPVRHKLLDLVGDLSLLGNFPVAHFLAYKASHNLHVQLAQQLAKQWGW
ncbi:MAG: UDP-3-O-acyl-N-acetylglucosamine deacetylase [Coleofasciculaceae cyanobacterium]